MSEHSKLGYSDEWLKKKLKDKDTIPDVFRLHFEMERETFEWLEKSNKNNKHNKRKVMLKRIEIKKYTDVKAYEDKLESGKAKLTLIIENGDNKVMRNEGNKLTAYFKEFTVLSSEQVRPIDALLIPGMVVKFERLFVMGDVLKAYEFMHELLPRMESLKEINVFGECDDSIFESVILHNLQVGREFIDRNSMYGAFGSTDSVLSNPSHMYDILNQGISGRQQHKQDMSRGWGFDRVSNGISALSEKFVDIEKVKSEVNSSAEVAGEINARTEHELSKLINMVRSNQKGNSTVMLITQDAPYIWEDLRASLGQGTFLYTRENPASEIAMPIQTEIYSLMGSELKCFIDWCKTSYFHPETVGQIILDINPYKWEEVKPLLVSTFPNLNKVYIPGGESFSIEKEEFKVLSKVTIEEDTYELRHYLDDNSKYVYCGTQKRFDRGYRVDDSAISLTIGEYFRNPLLPSLEVLNEDQTIDEIQISVSPSFEVGNEFYHKENNTKFELLEWITPNDMVKVRNTFSDEIFQLEASKLVRLRVDFSPVDASNKEYVMGDKCFVGVKPCTFIRHVDAITSELVDDKDNIRYAYTKAISSKSDENVYYQGQNVFVAGRAAVFIRYEDGMTTAVVEFKEQMNSYHQGPKNVKINKISHLDKDRLCLGEKYYLGNKRCVLIELIPNSLDARVLLAGEVDEEHIVNSITLCKEKNDEYFYPGEPITIYDMKATYIKYQSANFASIRYDEAPSNSIPSDMSRDFISKVSPKVNKEYEPDNELCLKKKDKFDVDNDGETIISGKRYICMNSTDIKFLEGTEVLAMVDGKEVHGTYVSDLNDIMYLVKLVDSSGSIGVEKGNVYVPVPSDKPLRINLNKDRLNNFIFFNQFNLNSFKNGDKVLFVSDFMTNNDKLAMEQMKTSYVTIIHMTSKEFIKMQTESTGPVEIFRIVVIDVCEIGKQACINIAQGMSVLETLIVFNNTDSCSTSFKHRDYSLDNLAQAEVTVNNAMKAMHDGIPVNVKDNFNLANIISKGVKDEIVVVFSDNEEKCNKWLTAFNGTWSKNSFVTKLPNIALTIKFTLKFDRIADESKIKQILILDFTKDEILYKLKEIANIYTDLETIWFTDGDKINIIR